jgi:hypothetical protein
MKVTVAPNAKARIHLPTKPGAKIRENGNTIAGSADIRLIASDSVATIVEVGSGTYDFRVSAA